MLQVSSLNYNETNFPSLYDVDSKAHRTKNVLEEYYNDSRPVSLSSSPEIQSIRTSCDERYSQRYTHAVLQPRVEGELCSIYEIPQKYRHIFNSYPCFNSVQSKVLDDVLYSDMPVIVSAPTGSGKTVIFELAIIRLLMKLDELKYEGDFIIVYMAPVKALCSERYFDWKAKFSALGINCQEVTGDTDDYTLANLPRSHLILTTPEKWDSLTRKWKDNTKMVQLVKLFLIDEVHLLSEEKRGSTLEAVVSRMKTITDVLRKHIQHKDISDSVQLPLGIRFMAISATIYNIEDVACWLGTSPDSPAKYFKISEEQRPVKLQKVVIGYPCPGGYSQFRFEISLSFKLRPLLFKYAEGKPTLIFCSTRKGVDQTCSTLSQQITFSFNEDHRRQLLEAAQTLSENKLKSCIVAGIGYHHAGMDRDDRHTVENLFRAGLLPVLVTTSTLAIGVNLPAHLVIIKATQQYAGGAYHDYTETQILQMIGRAGRPQYDTSAVAIIMTKESQKSRYENLIEGKEPLESNLHRHLAEHLNSEVVLHTITEVGHAIEWIRSTFLYVRALQNPNHYGIPTKLSKKGIETKLQEMCQRELNALASANLITVDNLTDIRPTANGAIMARFYLGLGTMKIFKKVTGQENMEDLLKLIAACEEFSGLQLRVNEKKNLNLLNKSKDHETIRFPLQGKITNTEMKVNCLIQTLFGCLPVFEQSLKQDMLRISWTGERVTMALCQYLLQFKHYRVLLYASILAKCFRCKLWENSPYVSRQLRGIGPALSSLLVASQKTSFQAIAESNPRDIELILNRAPPMGDALKAEVSHLPKFELRVEPVSLNPNLTTLNVYIEMSNKHLVQEYNAAGDNHWLVLIIGTSDNKCLLIERFRDTCLLQDSVYSRSVTVKHTASTEIYIYLISEQWTGLDVSLTTKFDEPCQAKHALDKYLHKIGIDSRGKSALQISSEAASVMKKRKRNSLSQEISAINEKSFYEGNRLTLDKFKFTPARKKKLAPSQQCISNYTIYESEITETNKNRDKYPAILFESKEVANGHTNLHLPYADKQLDFNSEQIVFERNDILENTANNFRQIHDENYLQERSDDTEVAPNPYYNTMFKYNRFKTTERAEDAESSDPKLCSYVSDNSETAKADTEVCLFTEPSEVLDTPFKTYVQENMSSKHSPSHTAANDNICCNGNSNITGWNKLIRGTQFYEPQQIHEKLNSTQHFSTDKSCLTEVFQSNQTCHTITSTQSHQSKQFMQDSNYTSQTNQAESILQNFKSNHNAQRAYNVNKSPRSAESLSSSDHATSPVNANENYFHGSDERRQMFMSDTQQHSQNKYSENDSNRSEVEVNQSIQKTDFDCAVQVNEEVGQLVSKVADKTQDEPKFKKALAKRFYPLFFKTTSTNDDEIERKEAHAESVDTQSNTTLEMGTTSLAEASQRQPKQSSRQTAFKLKHAFKDIQENEHSGIAMEGNREGSLVEKISPAPQTHECEHQHTNVKSKCETNNQLQLHSITSQASNAPTKSFTEEIPERMVETNVPDHINPKAVNIQTLKPLPDVPQNCKILQPALNFRLVSDFDNFFEKLSSADLISKGKQFYQHANEAEEVSLTPTATYNKTWAREYLFNRKRKTQNSYGNTKFANNSKRHGILQGQTVMHYNVPMFNEEKNRKTFPLNYIEAGPYTTNKIFKNDAQANKATVSLKANNEARLNEVAEELTSNYNFNQSFPRSELQNKFVSQITNTCNSLAQPKQHNELSYVPNDKYRDFANVTSNAHICSVEYSPSHCLESSEVFYLHPQHSKINDGPYILDSHSSKQTQTSNRSETIDNNSFFYEESNPKENLIFHKRNNELSQIFPSSNTYKHPIISQEELSDSCLNPTAINLEEADDTYSNDSLEEKTQDYDKYTSPAASSPLISNVSPQNSDCCDLPTPPLELSSDESDNCSQCSTCKATPTMEDLKGNNEPLVVPEQFATKQYSHMFPLNNLQLSLPAQLPIRNIQQVKQMLPATQQKSDSEYKRPRSIYLPNDKLQKFYPMSAVGGKIKFSPAYKKLKWLPR